MVDLPPPPPHFFSQVMPMCVHSNVRWSCCMLDFIMCMLLLIPVLFFIYWLPCCIFSALSSPQVRTGTIYIDKASKCRKKNWDFVWLCILIHSNTRSEVCFAEVHSKKMLYPGLICWSSWHTNFFLSCIIPWLCLEPLVVGVLLCWERENLYGCFLNWSAVWDGQDSGYWTTSSLFPSWHPEVLNSPWMQHKYRIRWDMLVIYLHA